MKKILVPFLAAVLVICLAACGTPAALADSAAPEAAAVDEEPDEAASAERERLVTGTVVYYDDAMLAICSGEKTLIFLVADDDIDDSGTRGLIAGSEADVHYIGQISGGNTSAARVTKLAQSAEQSKVNTDMGVTGGIIVSADASALSILSFGGESLTFSIAEQDIDMAHTNGLPVDAYVTVFYKGTIDGGNAEAVRVVKIVQ